MCGGGATGFFGGVFYNKNSSFPLWLSTFWTQLSISFITHTILAVISTAFGNGSFTAALSFYHKCQSEFKVNARQIASVHAANLRVMKACEILKL